MRGRHAVVIVPGSSDMLANLVSLRRLQRRAEDLGVEVLLAARDGLTRTLAREAGISTYVFSFSALWALRRRQKGQPQSEEVDAPALGDEARWKRQSAPGTSGDVASRAIVSACERCPSEAVGCPLDLACC